MVFELVTTGEFDGWLDAQAARVREMIATRLVRVALGSSGIMRRSAKVSAS